MVLKITNLHILRYLPTYWLYLLERYTIDNQRCTHTASGMNNAYLKLGVGYKNYTNFECYEKESVCAACDDLVNVLYG